MRVECSTPLRGLRIGAIWMSHAFFLRRALLVRVLIFVVLGLETKETTTAVSIVAHRITQQDMKKKQQSKHDIYTTL